MKYTLKLNNPNFTLTVRTPSDDHTFLHFLSHFGKKKIEKCLARQGIELTTFMSEGERGNH